MMRDLDIPLPQVQAVVELLDEGNTVPFITRYRKDRTGGLDEEKIRQIQAQLIKARFLADRKQTILRSIEAQGKLTEKLTKQILSAGSPKRLEDLYLPFKPKKQTLATTAKLRGLEPLAREILEADPACANLDARAADFVSIDRRVPTAAEALLGAGHILAEQISERAELRQRLREILQRTGRLVSARIMPEGRTPPKPEPVAAEPSPSAADAGGDPLAVESVMVFGGAADPQLLAAALSTSSAEVESAVAEEERRLAAIKNPIQQQMLFPEEPEVEAAAEAADEAAADAEAETPEEEFQPDWMRDEDELSTITIMADAGLPPSDGAALIQEAALASGPPPSPTGVAPAAFTVAERKRQEVKAERKALKEAAKKKKEEARLKAYADYYDYREDLKRIPPHRILAINRGERAKVLRVRLEVDLEAMFKALDELVVPAEHPHGDFLRGCARDALTRLVLPSLEREIRRELTEKAETHAVDVFARNLRNLLLQKPIRDRRILAVDPGFKSGCKLVALDQFGAVLEHGMIYLVGKPDRRPEAVERVVEMVTKHELSAVVIGNGTGCREAEDFIAGVIGNEMAGRGLAYVIVNEAGASVYSTSRVGREEFPQYDATLRGAISIGRRLQDPLSGLVKIDAANIGVGLYQHDVKAKHLGAMLDEVVESCVNFVGVDVNTASPALLRYVSGMNQLSARRVYEHRRQHGPFRSREQLKSVSGFGDASFVQAAGFLKITDGENPLDATWIHPESYEATGRALARLGFSPADLANKDNAAALAEKTAQVDLEALAKELEVGLLTLKDIVAQLVRPGRDPREGLPAPVFKQGVLKLEDLAPNMELTGTILNVVDFGAFVDIGVHHSGLIHVSQMADKFIRDPHDVVAVGDIVKVWVLEVDKQRRRVSLTMIAPGTPRTHGRRDDHAAQRPEERPPAAPDGDRPSGERPQRPQQQQRGDRAPQRGGDRPGGFQRRPRPGEQGGQGPRQRGDRDRGRGRDRDRDERPKLPPRPQPKKPLPPLTDEMKAGKAPLRTFGDLFQFYQQVQQPPPAEPESPANPESSQQPPAAPPEPPVAETPPQAAAVEPPQPSPAEPPSDGAPQ